MRSEREERRRASGLSEKKFLQKRKKKSLRFSRVVPACGPTGWAGGRAGGEVSGGLGVAPRLRYRGPVHRPSPPHTPQPRLQPWTAHPEPCAQTEVRRGAGGGPPGSGGGGGLRGCSACEGLCLAKRSNWGTEAKWEWESLG